MVLRYCISFQCPVLHKNVYVLGCLNCVWECLGGVCGSPTVYFLPVTSHSQNVLNFGVSVRCLKGVWKVSAGCLGDSGYCLVYWLSKKIIFGHNTQILNCSSSKPLMRKNTYVWGCLDGVWGCLGGVWRFLDGVWGSLDIVWEVETQNQLKTIQ